MQASEERERKIANVLETYFSDASLRWDKLFVSKMMADPDNSKVRNTTAKRVPFLIFFFIQCSPLKI